MVPIAFSPPPSSIITTFTRIITALTRPATLLSSFATDTTPVVYLPGYRCTLLVDTCIAGVIPARPVGSRTVLACQVLGTWVHDALSRPRPPPARFDGVPIPHGRPVTYNLFVPPLRPAATAICLVQSAVPASGGEDTSCSTEVAPFPWARAFYSLLAGGLSSLGTWASIIFPSLLLALFAEPRTKALTVPF